jgi:outer membrane protein assembly factor BamE
MVMRHLIIILALLCAACNAKLPSIKPFKMDIQQGNVVTSKMMLQLKPGMTKSQVRYIMGTPLIQDGFHPDRWDYFYQMRKDGEVIEQRRVIMEFENDALMRIRGDVIPAGSGQTVAEPEEPATSAKTRPKKAESKKGLLDRLMFWKDDEEEAQPQAAPEDLVVPAVKPADEEPAPAAIKTKPAVEAEPAESAPAPATAPAEDAVSPRTEEAAPAGQIAPAEEIAVEPAPMPTEAEPMPEVEPTEPTDEVSPSSSTAPAEAEPAAPQPAPAAESRVEQPELEAQQPATKAEPEPEADDDLPPEGAPGYFERMLEKIGF